MGRWHAHSAKQSGAQITAIIDSDLKAAERLAARFGGTSFSTLDQAIKNATFDVLHVCTPPGSHVELAKQALNANKHLIIEKPITSSTSELNALLEIAEARGLLLCPVHQFAFQHGVLAAKAELAKRSSAPLAVAFDFASAGGEGRNTTELNSLLIEIMPHPLSILSEVWPDQRLKHESLCVTNPRPGEMLAHGMLADMLVTIKISLFARPTHCTMTIYHQEGAIHLNLFHGFAVFESAKVSRLNKITQPFLLSLKTLYTAGINLARRAVRGEPAYPGLRLLIQQCYQAIESASPGPITGEHNLGVASLCEQFKQRLT